MLAHTLRTVSSPNRADTHTHTRTATKPELGRRKSKFQQRKRCRIFLWRPTLTGQAQSFALFTAAQRCQNTHHTRTQVCTQTCAQQPATKPELGRRESKHSSGSAAKIFHFTATKPELGRRVNNPQQQKRCRFLFNATKPELGRRESYSQQRKRCRILLSFRPNPNRAGETFQPETVT